MVQNGLYNSVFVLYENVSNHWGIVSLHFLCEVSIFASTDIFHLIWNFLDVFINKGKLKVKKYLMNNRIGNW